MSSLRNSIPIIYYNRTNSVDFDVLVFAKVLKSSIISNPYVAWQILRGQTSVSFVYPVNMQVGATYINKDQVVTAGPFDTNEGSTWEIVQDRSGDTAQLKQG